MTDLFLRRYAERKQFDKGMKLVNQISALDEFPYDSAAKLMEAMPPGLCVVADYVCDRRQPLQVRVGYAGILSEITCGC